jgi:hypothetical protein
MRETFSHNNQPFMTLGAPFALSLIFDGMLLNISMHIPIKQETMVLMSIVMFDLNKN